MIQRAMLPAMAAARIPRSEEHTSELQSQSNLVCRLLLEKKNETTQLLAGAEGSPSNRVQPMPPPSVAGVGVCELTTPVSLILLHTALLHPPRALPPEPTA